MPIARSVFCVRAHACVCVRVPAFVRSCVCMSAFLRSCCTCAYVRERVRVSACACARVGNLPRPCSHAPHLQGLDTTSELPPERWDINSFYDEDVDVPGKTYPRILSGFSPF